MKKRVLLSISLLLSFTIYAQNISVNGLVIDSEGDPVIGATIVIMNSTELTGTSTDADGRYTLNNVPSNATLRFTYIGMTPQEIEIKGRSNINITMVEDSENLDEIVVIGYGSMRKQDLTGAVGQVRTRELSLAPVASFDEALAGRVAGVQVSSFDGQPGGGSSIIIRGASSLTQDNSPLYVIDGVAIEDPDNAAINNEEIASMTILKDASATAIYGSRAANGVIIIETKKGLSAKPVISFGMSTGYQEPIKMMNMMSPYDFVRLQSEINPITTMRLYTPGQLPVDDEYYDPNGRILEDYRDVEGTNWQSLILNREPVQRYNISIRGKSLGTAYSISGSYFDQRGIVKSTGFNRYQGRMNITQEVSDKMKVSLNANYTKSLRDGQKVNDGGGGNFTTYLLTRAWQYRPISGNPDINLQDYLEDPDIDNPSDVRVNPLMSSENDYTKMPSTNFSVLANLDYKIIEDLTFRSLVSYYVAESGRSRFYNSKTTQVVSRLNTKGVFGDYYNNKSESVSSENTLTYRTIFQEDHSFNLVGGMSMNKRTNERFGYSSQHIPNEALGMYGFREGLPFDPVSSGGYNSMLSYFGRADYNYKSILMLTASIRADGSSKFVKENRWGYFPSAALGWDMRETFFKSFKTLSEAKLRISYGLTGNNRVGDYDYLSTVDLSTNYAYPFNNNTPIHGIVPSSLSNRSLKWETTKQTNLGLDIGFFKERITLNVDLYKKLTEDLLLYAELPSTTGHSNSMRNIGAMSNTGFEFSLQTINVSSPKFSWSSNFNISFNENKILELTRNQNKLITNMVVIQDNSQLYISRIGYPAGMFFGYIFDGIYQIEDFDSPAEGVYSLKKELSDNGANRNSIQPGHIKYKDLNNDGTIDSHDMAIIGRGQPIHFGGLTNTLYYNGFSLNVFFQWSYGNQIFNANRMRFEGSAASYNVNAFESYNDRWTPENRSNTLYTVGGFGPPGYQSDRVLEDGSYLRLKTLSLSYRIPRKITQKWSIDNLTLRLAGQNILTFTNYSGMDPEVSVKDPVLSPGFDWSAYPQARTVTLGIDVTL